MGLIEAWGGYELELRGVGQKPRLSVKKFGVLYQKALNELDRELDLCLSTFGCPTLGVERGRCFDNVGNRFALKCFKTGRIVYLV